MKQLRVGILGTGKIAAAHVKSLQKLPAVAVVGLCNHHVEKAQAFNAKVLNGRATCYGDFQQMLKAEKLDVLYAALPPGAITARPKPRPHMASISCSKNRSPLPWNGPSRLAPR